MLELVLGRSGTGKTEYLYRQMQRKMQAGQSALILLVPEQYSHAAERELTAFLGSEASLFAEVLSFKRLASRVETELGGGAKKSLDEGGRMLCMRLAMEAVHSQLRLYKQVNRKPEFLAGLLKTIDELKQNNVSADHLLDFANWTEGTLCDKLHDLAYLSGAYERISGRLDPRDRLTRLADKITDSSFVNAHFFVDGFSDFTAQESQILRKLLRFGASATMSFTCDGLLDGNPIFAPAVHTARFFERFGRDLSKTVTVTNLTQQRERPPAIAEIERHLFSGEPIAGEAQGMDAGLTLLEAQNPMEECRQAAALVREMVRTKGYRYRDIAVAVRGFTDYEHILEAAFSYYDIPVHISKKANLLDKPILQIFTGAFDILETNWSYEAVFRYLRTGLAGIAQTQVDILEAYVKKYGIKGSAWTKKTPWKEHPTQFGQALSVEDKALLSKINNLRDALRAPLMELQENTRGKRAASGQALALYRFLEAIDLPQTLTDKALYFGETGRELIASEYLQIWDILVGALEQVEAILDDSPMEFKEFSTLMRLCLGQYEIGTIPQTIDRVHMGDLDKIRRRDIKCLIVLGATDTRLPSPNLSSGVFTEFERQWLMENDMPLSGTAEESVYLEYTLMYHVFTLPKEELVLSYPKEQSGGEESRKSPILHRIERLFGIVCKALADPATLYYAPKPAFDLALQKNTVEQDLNAMARAYFAEEKTLDALDQQILGVERSLSPRLAEQLYGSPLVLSPSRLENFRACPFRFFMEYGLRAKASKKVDIDAPMEGNFMHSLLEKISREVMDEGGFHEKSTDIAALTQKHIAAYEAEHLGDLSGQTERFQYLFSRLCEDSFAVVSDMAEELSHSSFVPLKFELGFGEGLNLPPLEFTDGDTKVLLRGTVDRIDGWVADEKLHLRVIDYKTGHTQFSLSDVWHGQGMQMLLYLFALQKSGEMFFGGLPIVPAGVLYIPAKEMILPTAKQIGDVALDAERRKKRRRSGLLLCDETVLHAMENSENPQYIPITFSKDGALKEAGGGTLVSETEFQQIQAHVEEKVIRLAAEIAGGKVTPKPLAGSLHEPCTYCDFRAACHHDKAVHGVQYLPKLSRNEILGDEKEGVK